MTTSNSVDFSINRDEIITAAMRAARIIGADQVPTSGEITSAAQALNMIVKQWQGKTDFAPGLKEWSRKRATLFLQTATSSYSLGPTGDHWTGSYSSTTLAAGKIASATSITLVSAIGANADNIGIVLTSGAIGWTTISAGGGTTSITLPANSLGAASSGATVYTYTTKARRPEVILTAVLRDSTGTDVPLSFMTLEDYEMLPDKTGDNDPTSILYEGQLTNGVLYTDAEASDVTKVIRCVFLSAIEDFDVLTDTPDYPQAWYRPLKYQLAIDLAPEFGRAIAADLKMLRDESLMMAQQLYAEVSHFHFEPGRE
jgi:hypothetical protein